MNIAESSNSFHLSYGCNERYIYVLVNPHLPFNFLITQLHRGRRPRVLSTPCKYTFEDSP